MKFDLRNRRVLVLGLGITGYSLVRYLLRRGAQVMVADTRTAPPFADRLAMEFPQVEAYYGEFTKLLFVGIDGIAISPGIAKDHPLICAAVADGVPLFGDVELFAQALPKNQRVLAITGSNGKTTTTELTRVLCEAAGLSAIAAGNIGEPVLDVLECFEGGAFFPDVFVLELSSYQLETTMSLSPSAAAILNISENHLDRYPDMDVYTAAKARIFDRAKAQVLNIDDARVRAMAMADKTVHYFGTEETDLRPFWSLRNHEGALWLQCNERTLMASDTLSLMGRHNALNALAALALTACVVGIDGIDDHVLSALRNFRGLPHRMEIVGEIGGVRYINDSKATTVAATLAALEGLTMPTILIAGGDGKKQSFVPLAEAVAQHCRAVLLIGRDAPLIEKALMASDSKVTIENCGTLDQAVRCAKTMARSGDIVLLSPACASLDQFADYLARGIAFTELIGAGEMR